MCIMSPSGRNACCKLAVLIVKMARIIRVCCGCELGDNYYYAAAGGYSASQRSQTFYCDVCKVDCVGSQVGHWRQTMM